MANRGSGGIIALAMTGQTIGGRGEKDVSDSAVFLHNGAGRYDFVIGKGTKGPAFQSVSFADKGDLTKEQAIEAFKAAGYVIDKTGGVKDGKMVLDK